MQKKEYRISWQILNLIMLRNFNQFLMIGDDIVVFQDSN